ncbi:MAG: helix-turn-helix domain-containing protein [Rhodococcus sp. (in: high G+C Gram-positive bacteria)]|uniref:helix-turn-helix domain-containing protein n=1 Tax=Rhodococcus sp. TaxID=1831 RepID=UPI003BB571B2
MSIEALAWALKEADIPSPTPAGMPSAAALTIVLVGLANHASDTGDDAYPSVRTLAAYARVSERQAQRCLAALLELGVITLGDQRIVAAKIRRADRRPTCYRLLMRRGDQPSPGARPRGDSPAPHGVTGSGPRGDTGVTRTVLEPEKKTAARSCASGTRRTSACPPGTPAAAAYDDGELTRLAAELRTAGLTASFRKLDADGCAQVSRLIDRCGVDALVASARAQHQPQSPARFVQAWLPMWRELPARAVPTPRCGRCDEYGWLADDEHGRAVRCGCRASTQPQKRAVGSRSSSVSSSSTNRVGGAWS